MWEDCRRLLSGAIFCGGKKGSRYLAGDRAIVSVDEATYLDAVGLQCPIVPSGRRRRVTMAVLDDGEATGFTLPEVTDLGDSPVFRLGGVWFSTRHLELFRLLGRTVAYVGRHHLRAAPIGGDIAFGVDADVTAMSELSGWIKCPTCGGRGHVRGEL